MPAVRSPREIAFRLKQEAANLCLLAAQPVISAEQPASLSKLPDPASVVSRLRGTEFAAEVVRFAEAIADHCFPLLGVTVQTGPTIDWRRDYVHGVSSPQSYFRFIRYLDFSLVGDHKLIWELNRHQHLVLLAQAFLFTGQKRYFDEIVRQLESWFEANPFLRGMNWASALEVAFRALSWIWVYHWTGNLMDPRFRRRYLTELYRHGLYLEYNLSVYYSPNTHLLGEAVALHALGVLFPGFPRARKWQEAGKELVRAQMDFQVREDGSHFEQSSYYQVYALDFFLFHHILENAPDSYGRKLRRMADYLAAIQGPSRALFLLGDDDGGRVFHPYGPRDTFGRATLATCDVLFPDGGWHYETEDLYPQAVWWLGEAALEQSAPQAKPPLESRLFPQSGLAVMTAGDLHLLVDAGPFGYGGAGHSHSDSLSIVARRGAEEILIDPGTYTYVAEPAWRAWFRGSAAHNTVRVDGSDQAIPAGPFHWTRKPKTEVRAWISTAEYDFLDATCAYQFVHRRRVLFLKPASLILVVDDVDGPPGEHSVEQFWHLGGQAACSRLIFPATESAELSQGAAHGWRSPAFGTRKPAPVLRIHRRCVLPVVLAAAIDVSPAPRADELFLATRDGEYFIHSKREQFPAIRFPLRAASEYLG